MNAHIRLQNLRDITVQIYHVGSKRIAGSGIVVSLEGVLVTSAHTLRRAGVNPHDIGVAEVPVCFPQARGSEQKTRQAVVAATTAADDGCLVVLHLRDGIAPLDPEQIAVVGAAAHSEGHHCCSLAYGDNARLHYATGKIVSVAGGAASSSAASDPATLNGAAVLDVERNLVVGIIAHPAAVGTTLVYGAQVLTFGDAVLLQPEPCSVPLRTTALDLRSAPRPQTDTEAARNLANSTPGTVLNGAPPLLASLVGRDDVLRTITTAWSDTRCRVLGVVGAAGLGKSSLVRHWLEELLADRLQRQPAGVFWWNFAERPGIDAFFEAVLAHLSGRMVDTRQYPSSNAQVQVIGAMLSAGAYLFVLDGLEVLQHQQGDQYGVLKSADMRELLRYVAAPGHDSFCLLTSRLPILDLLDYTSYTHCPLAPLTAEAGRTLLQQAGASGTPADLESITAVLHHHPLTLSLMGSYLREHYGGDVMQWRREDGERDLGEHAAEMEQHGSIPTHLQQVLHLLDSHMDEAEHTLLLLLSAFRTPVDEHAFSSLFGSRPGVLDRFFRRTSYTLLAPISKLSYGAFEALLQHLIETRILCYDRQTHSYTTHPLIASYYYALLTQSSQNHRTPPVAGQRGGSMERRVVAHTRIKDYYLAIAGEMPRFPTLDDLAPLIEAVYHACRAGAYDEAFHIYWERIEQGERKAFGHQLGAYETLLALMLEFFPNGDTSEEPQVSDPTSKQLILDTVGFCLVNLERLSEAVPFYERKNRLVLQTEDWHNASIGYRNLVGLLLNLGQLAASTEAAEDALTLAHEVENRQSEMSALVYQAWVYHLCGELEQAKRLFEQAQALQQQLDPKQRYLYSQDGVWHAEHLRRMGETSYARQVTQRNLDMCDEYRWVKSLCQCWRLLGDMDAAASQHERAQQYYDEALAIARTIAHRPTLIEVLLARGRWSARAHEHYSGTSLEAARGDLDEALGYAIASGYRLAEADIRVGLAWVYYAAGDVAAATADARCAQRMSAAMGYHWGAVDAAEVLGQMQQPRNDA